MNLSEPTQNLDTAARLRLAVTRTARRLRQEANADLTPSLMAALATVDRHGPLTPSELAQIERVRRPTATKVAARLEERALIARAGDPDDGRVTLLSITDEGRALLERARSRKNAYLASRMENLSPEDLAALERAADVLERMLEERER
ncbi:MAG: MarR family winged helix-turn-helix transcriptional regulator [Thermoleophilaceae bacterium]